MDRNRVHTHRRRDIWRREHLTELREQFGLPNWLDLEFLAGITLAILVADEELELGLFYDYNDDNDEDNEDEVSDFDDP